MEEKQVALLKRLYDNFAKVIGQHVQIMRVMI
jgi:hypothetical protein